MNKIDLVRSAIDTSNPDRFSVLADDFQFTNSMGEPAMDKSGWQGMGQMMETSFSNLVYETDEIKEEGDEVRVTGHFSGTFTSDFDLSPMGMAVIPATGKKVTWPSATSLITIKEGKITRFHSLATGQDAGMAGFLKALGVG